MQEVMTRKRTLVEGAKVLGMSERQLTGYKTIGYSSQKAAPSNQDLNPGRKAPELAYQMEQIT